MRKITKQDILGFVSKSGFGSDQNGILPIERDYLLNIILIELYKTDIANRLVFKGGTALKKVFFSDKFNSYRFSKDLDFNVVGDISIKRLEGMIDKLCDNLAENHSLRFERIGRTQNGEYGEDSHAIKIRLKDRGFIFDNQIRIKFDFSIKKNYTKKYKRFEIKNHYKEFLSEEIFCLCETLEELLDGKLNALFGDTKRTEPRDVFDIVNIVKSSIISEKNMKNIFKKHPMKLGNERKTTLERGWNIFFSDQLPQAPIFDEYILFFENLVKR